MSRTETDDDGPDAWARAVRTLLRRAHRGHNAGVERTRILDEASRVFADYRGHASVNAETLLGVLARRVAARSNDSYVPSNARLFGRAVPSEP